MKKNIIFSILLLLLLSFTFLNNCGIEDSLIYFQEPRNLHFEADGFLYFNGANQEQDDGNNLFVGYDVYYYFNNSKDAKKAMVVEPSTINKDNTKHADLVTFSTGTRFPSGSFSDTYMANIYQYITFPVTESMIDNVLEKDKNDNVRICFHNSNLIDDTAELNPKQNASSYITMEELFPNYSEYNGKSWAVDAAGNNFQGFLDQDYYDSKGIPGRDGSGYKEYDFYIYVVAKGFNSYAERNTNYIESLKSNVIKITLKALDSTNNY